MKKIAIVAITKNGRKIAKLLKNDFRNEEVYCFIPSQGELKDLTATLFNKDKFDGIVFIMAMGIVIRMIAPYLKDKYRDPAVVAVDDSAHFAIAALSGHEGGANTLAVRVANILGAEPVITTASESKKDIIIGIGCRRGIQKDDVISGIKQVISQAGVALNKVKYIATIDLKKDEVGLGEACAVLGIPLRIISQDLIKRFNGKYQKSSFVKRKIGVWGVCEPCALLAGRKAKLILPKIKLRGITLAVAKES